MLRRHLLASVSSFWLASTQIGHAGSAQGFPAWKPDSASPPPILNPGPWVFFAPEEGSAVEAMADRIIPPDPETPGAKDAGCAVYIDHQLAGDFGSSATLYMQAPFHAGTPSQGPQSADTPRVVYRNGLAALSRYCKSAFVGKEFSDLAASQQDQVLSGLETGKIMLPGYDGKAFFKLVLKNVMEGFFADPIYGGNRDMVGWKMIGFPGTRYDYRDWVDKHNQHYPLPPVSIADHSV
jgi:gluconate 2-dehydrogenase gamma chain